MWKWKHYENHKNMQISITDTLNMTKWYYHVIKTLKRMKCKQKNHYFSELSTALRHLNTATPIQATPTYDAHEW